MVGFTALILAGRRAPTGDGLNGTQLKALMPISGTPMIDRVIKTVSASKYVKRIIVSGPSSLGTWTNVTFVPTGTSPANSILQFLENRTDNEPVFVTTADHPLLTTEMVDHFLSGAMKSDTDLVVGMVDKNLVKTKYATSRTGYKFRDGVWKSCNLFACMTPHVAKMVHFWQFVEKNRKKPLRVVRAFGLWTLISVLLGRWNLRQALSQAGARIGITVEPVIMPWPEAAIDVDTMDDKALAESILDARPQLA
ncbi:MAG: nucleotidyltransferase family protein [Rhodospirillaceae bacterium]|nr:nucleotidyltransferase family protein [Rhodospirillaceae bacterium]